MFPFDTNHAAELSDADLECVVGGKQRNRGSGSSGGGGNDTSTSEKKPKDTPSADPKLDRFFERQNQN